jgi:hypothetical protein
MDEAGDGRRHHVITGSRDKLGVRGFKVEPHLCGFARGTVAAVEHPGAERVSGIPGV